MESEPLYTSKVFAAGNVDRPWTVGLGGGEPCSSESPECLRNGSDPRSIPTGPGPPWYSGGVGPGVLGRTVRNRTP